jgi:hypothetical protein
MAGLMTHRVGLAAQAGGAPALLDLDFLTATYIGATPSCTRSTQAYAETSTGALTSFATNTMRITDLGLFVEPGATNQSANSEDFGSWITNSTCSVTTNTDTGPNGATTADTITSINTGASQVAQLSTVGSGATFTASCFVKAGTASRCYIQINNEPFAHAVAKYFDLSGSGTVGSTQHLVAGFTVVNATIRAMANGYYWISFTVTSGSGNPGAYFYLGPCDADGSRAVTASRTMYAWGGQLEIHTTYTTPITTTSGTATRASDTVSFTIPSGVSNLLYTFDDNSTQSVSVSPGSYNIPTNLNRRFIKTVVGS